MRKDKASQTLRFPISRDPPEGGTRSCSLLNFIPFLFPISRDPPEGGTGFGQIGMECQLRSFQFLGIPPKGELFPGCHIDMWRNRFQFLGIPPKGEQGLRINLQLFHLFSFQFLGIPPKGEQPMVENMYSLAILRFQFLGIPPKGELLTNRQASIQLTSPSVSNF